MKGTVVVDFFTNPESIINMPFISNVCSNLFCVIITLIFSRLFYRKDKKESEKYDNLIVGQIDELAQKFVLLEKEILSPKEEQAGIIKEQQESEKEVNSVNEVGIINKEKSTELATVSTN